MKPTARGAPVEKTSLTSNTSVRLPRRKIMLIGMDRNHVLEKRFQASGYEVLSAENRESALAMARHRVLDGALLLSQDSLLNVAETILSLKDLCPFIKITIVLRQGAQPTDRFVRQLMDHPIQGSEIMTRRELQNHLRQEALKRLF